MRIEKCDAWRIGTNVFFSAEKAQDYAEGLIFAAVKKALLPKGFSEAECFKVAEVLIGSRCDFACLLSFEVAA